MNIRHIASAIAIAIAMAAAGLLAGAATPATGLQQPASSPDALLRGAIDIHVHSLPDDRPRSIDDIDEAIMAKARGMRAIVLKDHYESTAGRVYLVRKVVPGIEVFGGIDLNLTVGGMNAAAVEHMTMVTGGWGRFVWMSTFDAENNVRYEKQDRPFVRVSRNGELLPETKAVIATIARHGNLVLATGHVAPAEGLMLLREARRLGVRHMVVTHAINPPVEMSVTQMQDAAKEGAFIEFVGGALKGPEGEVRMDKFADAIKKVGAAYCILSSDLGQQGNALPADGFAAFIAAMRKRGISGSDVDRMTKQNPAALLELP
jgi:hypothetical protein